MKSCGMSLLELLIGLVVIAIACACSIPSVHALSAASARARYVQVFNTVLRYARIQAFIRQQPLQLVALDDKTQDWAHGVQLINPHHEARDALVYAWAWHFPGLHAVWHGFRSANAIYIDDDLQHLALNGYFSVQYAEKELQNVVVTRFGRVH